MKVFVVIADGRENHLPLLGVRSTYDGACEVAKEYMLKHNSNEGYEMEEHEMYKPRFRNMNARAFYEKYAQDPYNIIPSIEEAEVI